VVDTSTAAIDASNASVGFLMNSSLPPTENWRNRNRALKNLARCPLVAERLNWKLTVGLEHRLNPAIDIVSRALDSRALRPEEEVDG